MNNIEEDIKIVKEFNEKNRFRDCGIINNAIDHVLAEMQEDKKTIRNLKYINSKLRTIRVEHEYGCENTHLLLKEDITHITVNKYFIEVEDGKMVDVKQLYLDNLNSIPKEKVKDIIEETKNRLKKYINISKGEKLSFSIEGVINLLDKLKEKILKEETR